MTEIKKGINFVVQEFDLEAFLLKPKRDEAERIKHTSIVNPSFESAAALDKQGQWEQAANHYFTIFSESQDPPQKAQAYIGLSQMYINLVKYNLAREYLEDNQDQVVNALSGWDRTFFQAQALEKLGWVNDYLGETDEAIAHFSQAKQLLSAKAKEDDTVLRVYETSNHFLGRQYAILAWQNQESEDSQKDTALAINRFKESIQIYQALASRGKADYTAEGFQYAWLTRMHILQGQFTEAENDLAKVKELFEKDIKKPGEGRTMGYYYLLLGRLRFEQKKYQTSRENFAKSLQINTEVEYPSSQADALFGMGLCDYTVGDKTKAQEEINKALSINPSLLYRGYI